MVLLGLAPIGIRETLQLEVECITTTFEALIQKIVDYAEGSAPGTGGTRLPCSACGRTSHTVENCKFFDGICGYCGVYGHWIADCGKAKAQKSEDVFEAVSYTHLTLPTICSV